MLEFLADYPFILILLIYGLVSLFGKKKANKAVEKSQAAARAKDASRQQNQNGARANANTSASKRLANAESSLQRMMEQADRRFAEGSQDTQPVSPAPVTAGTPPAAGDPYAFRSLLHKEEGEENYDVKAVDYDVKSVDYDVTAVDYDVKGVDYDTQKPSSFAYRPALNETPEQAFHLTGFQAFHSAQGLTDADRARSAGGATTARKHVEPIVVLGGADDIRRALVMQEILGKPKALRR